MNNERLVTIIIPVYNVEKYLNACVKSVVEQTYNSLEIILVDDGSPDGSPMLCDEWEKKDGRIRVIHKENGGLGEARNSGLRVANGDYIFFLDSDDFIALDAIEKLVSFAIKENADLVGSGQYRTDDSGNVSIDRVPNEYRVYRGGEIRDCFLPDLIAPNPKTGHYIKTGACISGQLFSHDLIIRSRWQSASEREVLSEDIYSFTQLCGSVKCAVEAPIITMYYRRNPESLSQSYREDRYAKNVVFYKKYLKMIKQNDYGLILEKRAPKPFLNNTIACLKQIVSAHESKRKKIRLIRAIVNDSTLQKAIRVYDFSGEKKSYRFFFTVVRCRLSIIAYILLLLKK